MAAGRAGDAIEARLELAFQPRSADGVVLEPGRKEWADVQEVRDDLLALDAFVDGPGGIVPDEQFDGHDRGVAEVGLCHGCGIDARGVALVTSRVMERRRWAVPCHACRCMKASKTSGLWAKTVVLS